ncbi:TULIP family P47-like protein [Furfurilactobacillus entadae]|uniref:TULIP family P47-like protein n=1 Tax=Furfurilactobacillus entadae TaxID=2922307 RepID=UPI0035EF16D9
MEENSTKMDKLYTIDWNYLDGRQKIMNYQQEFTPMHLQVLSGDVAKSATLSADLNTLDILPSTEGKRLDIALTMENLYFQSQFQKSKIENNQLVVNLSVPIIINAEGIELDTNKPIVDLKTEIDPKNMILNSEFQLLLHQGLYEEQRLAQIIQQISNRELAIKKEPNKYAGTIKENEDISTFGWDIVSGASFQNVNRQIKLQNTFPQDIEAIYKDDLTGTVTIDGHFMNWELTTSGDGKNVTFKCTFKSATIVNFETSKGTETAPLDENNWFEVQVPLATFNDEHGRQDATGKNDGQFETLKISKLNENDESNIKLIDTAYPEKIENVMTFKVMMDSLLKKYIEDLSHDKKALQHVFSFLQLGETANEGRWQWLKAKYVSYAVAATESIDTSVFAVMYQTTSDTIPDTQQVDARLLKNGTYNQTILAISKLAYFKNVIYEALPYADILPQSDVDIDTDNLVITNKKKFDYAFLKDNNTKISVDEGQFKLGFFNNDFQLNVAGKEPFTEANKKGILHHSILEKTTLAFKDGGIYLKDEGSEFSTTVESENIDSDWFSWESFAIGIASSLAIGGICYGAVKYGSKIAKILKFDKIGRWFTSRVLRRGNRYTTPAGNSTRLNLASTEIELVLENERRRLSNSQFSLSDRIDGYESEARNSRKTSDDLANDPEQERSRAVNDFADRYASDTALIKTGMLSRCAPFEKDTVKQALAFVYNKAINDLVGDTTIQEENAQPVGIDDFWKAITDTIQWPDQSEIKITDAYCNGIITLQGEIKG